MQKNPAAKTVDDYLKNFSGEQLATLKKIRRTIKAIAPNAEEVISYGIPAYRQNGMIAYFAGFKKHCSYFPGSGAVIKQFEEELKAYKVTKGTIQFPIDQPLASALIKKMVLAKIKTNDVKVQAKANKNRQDKTEQ